MGQVGKGDEFWIVTKSIHIFYLGGTWGNGVTWSCLGGGIVFSPHHLLSKRLRASDPFILLQSLRNLKKKKKQGPPKRKSLLISYFIL